MSDTPFEQLVARVRSGDKDATEQLWREYEPVLRRVLRVRLTDPNLRRQFDEDDVANSVFGDFFPRIAQGEFKLETPEKLTALLVTMAQNKFLRKVAKQRTQKRDIRITTDFPSSDSRMAGPVSTPSHIVMRKELGDKARRLMSDEERYLSEQRALGRTWPELAQELNVAADTLRRQHDRTEERIERELGLRVVDSHDSDAE